MKTMNRTLAMLTMAAPLLAGATRVTVLHTNDTHAHVDDAVVAFSTIAAEKARIKASGENVILADAGDYVQGTALGGYDSGKSVIDIMGAAGYDVATLGNHEFDYGIAAMFSNVGRAKFRTTSCNFVSRKSADADGAHWRSLPIGRGACPNPIATVLCSLYSKRKI